MGVLLKSRFAYKVIASFPASSFEMIHLVITAGSETIRLITLYRVPPSSKNKISPTAFIDELSQFLESLASTSGRLILVGDFNVHWDVADNNERVKLADLLDMYGLAQHVSGQTHKKGHTLDFIIARKSESVVKEVHTDSLISDHHALLCTLVICKPPPQRERITYRIIGNIDFVKFNADLKDQSRPS